VIGAVSSLKSRFAEASPEVKMALADQFGLVTKYLDTVYLLSDWPVLNYLSNLVFTTNAFVLYAERSLALPEGAVADEPAPSEPAAMPAEGQSTPDAVVDAAGIDPAAAPAPETGETGTADQSVAGEPVAVEPAASADPNANPEDAAAGLAADDRSTAQIDPAAAAAGTEPPAPGAAEDPTPEGAGAADGEPDASLTATPDSTATPTADGEEGKTGEDEDEGKKKDDEAQKAAA
jgi:hypothetical protein